MRPKRQIFWLLITVFAVFGVVPLAAQDDAGNTCPTIVESAYEITDESCDGIGRDEACYGNVAIEAEPGDLEFEAEGDLVSLDELDGLRLSEMDQDNNVWGISLMRVRTVDPEGGPAQFVEMLLFGNVEVTDDSDSDQAADLGYGPLQAFTFSAGAEDAQCEEAPTSGILIQTPQGVGQVSLLINEVLVDIGSTAYLRLTNNDDLSISVLEGEAIVEADGSTVTVEVGRETIVPLTNLSASGAPSQPQLYSDLGPVPVCLLSRPFILDVTSTFTEDASNGIEIGQVAAIDLVFPVRDTLCPRDNTPSDVVLVMDVSGSMGGSRIIQARAAASQFVNQLDDSVDRVALVKFESDAEVVTNLTSDFDVIQGGIAQLIADGGTDIAAGLTVGNSVLLANAREDASPVVVLLSDGQSDFQEAVDAAGDIVENGGQVISVGIGSFDESLMRGVASAPEDFLETNTPIYLRELFEQTALDIGGERPVACDITVSYTVDDENFELVEPLALGGEIEGNTVTWKINTAFEGQVLTRSLGVRALEGGVNPVGLLEVTYNPCDEPSLTSAGAFEGPELEVVEEGEADPDMLVEEGILPSETDATGELDPFGFSRWLYTPGESGIYSVIVSGSGDNLPVSSEGGAARELYVTQDEDDALVTVFSYGEADASWLYVQSNAVEDAGDYEIRVEPGFGGDSIELSAGDTVEATALNSAVGNVFLLEEVEAGDRIEVRYQGQEEGSAFPSIRVLNSEGDFTFNLANVVDSEDFQRVDVFDIIGEDPHRLYVSPALSSTYTISFTNEAVLVEDFGELDFDEAVTGQLNPYTTSGGEIGPGSVHLYTFEAEAGDAIQFTLNKPSSGSISVDIQTAEQNSYVGGDFVFDAGDNIIGPITIEEDGTYNLVMTSFDNQVGNYTLSAELVEIPDPVLADIAPGDVVTGTLFGERPDEYQFEGEAGNLVIITMDQTDNRLDSVLTLIDEEGNEVFFNDDSGGSRNSRIGPFELPADGQYTILASAFSSGSSGSYELTFTLINPEDGIPVSANSNVNLRSGPGTNFAIAGSASSGDTLIAVGQNAAGDWLQVITTQGETVWIFVPLVDSTTAADALSNLPVLNADGSPVDAESAAIEEATAEATEEAEAAVTTSPEATGDCTVTASNNVNRRSGPSTDFPVVGVLEGDTTQTIVGQLTDSQGFVWWELDDDSFVRSDTVEESGSCESVPQSE